MSPTILPGATIGFLGGGQLARMGAMAARAMGYRVAVLDPDPGCAAAPVADRVVLGAFDDEAAAAELARGCQVVTLDIERIGPGAARAADRLAPLHPCPGLLEVVQDRAAQKRWLEGRGFPVGPWLPVDDEAGAAAAVARLGPSRLKRRGGGYDGRGQAPAPSAAGAAAAFRLLGGAPCVVERELALSLELSVLVARSPAGALAVHPPARNWHRDGVLDRSVLPAPLPPGLEATARALARGIAEGLGLVGLLAVELFVDAGGRLLVNELAPRPHNTFHHAGLACPTGQFEQLVRAICDLPLGDTEPRGAAALLNLLGDAGGRAHRALEVPGVSLHLYGKAPRPGRKVGHLCAVGATPEEALARLGLAEARLTPPDAPRRATAPAGAGDGAGAPRPRPGAAIAFGRIRAASARRV